MAERQDGVESKVAVTVKKKVDSPAERMGVAKLVVLAVVAFSVVEKNPRESYRWLKIKASLVGVPP